MFDRITPLSIRQNQFYTSGAGLAGPTSPYYTARPAPLPEPVSVKRPCHPSLSVFRARKFAQTPRAAWTKNSLGYPRRRAHHKRSGHQAVRRDGVGIAPGGAGGAGHPRCRFIIFNDTANHLDDERRRQRRIHYRGPFELNRGSNHAIGARDPAFCAICLTVRSSFTTLRIADLRGGTSYQFSACRLFLTQAENER